MEVPLSRILVILRKTAGAVWGERPIEGSSKRRIAGESIRAMPISSI